MIRIYRKASVYSPPKVLKADRERLLAVISLKCRVSRPGLLEHFLSGDFHRQEALDGSVVKSKADRILDHSDAGFTVPDDSLGRAAEPSAESIRLWIAQWIAGDKSGVALVNPDEVAVVVE